MVDSSDKKKPFLPPDDFDSEKPTDKNTFDVPETINGRTLFMADDDALMHRFKPGALINDRYTVQRKIGEGGMAIVFLASDNMLDQDVVLKVPRASLMKDPTLAAQFKKEVLLTMKLSHPNIVRVHDIQEDSATGLQFFTMEYLDGQPLRNILIAENKLPLDKAKDILIQIIQGLSLAHSQHIIHRDLKPENIFITKDGTVKIMDFGIAAQVMNTTMRTKLQSSGTPNYIAPEQLQGKKATPGSDIYALGVILYEMLTGSLPVGRWRMPTELDPSIPSIFDTIVETCLEAQPERRYSNVKQITTALVGETPPVTSAPPAQKATKPEPPASTVPQPEQFGDLSVTTSENCEISIDGKRQHETRNNYILLSRIPYGEHILKGETATKSAEKTVSVNAPLVKTKLDLTPKTGTLYAKGDIGPYKLSIQETTYDCPERIENLAVGTYTIHIYANDIGFSAQVEIKGNETTEFVLTEDKVAQGIEQIEAYLAQLMVLPEETLDEQYDKLKQLRNFCERPVGKLKEKGEEACARLLTVIEAREQEEAARKRKLEREKRVWRIKQGLKIAAGMAAVILLIIAINGVSGYVRRTSTLKNALASNDLFQLYHYKEVYPDSDLTEVNAAIRRLEDDRDFSQAQTAGTLDRMNAYIKTYGADARHLTEAKQLIQQITEADDAAWAKAKKAHTVQAYRAYLEKRGNDAIHRIEANQAIQDLNRKADEAAWAKAKRKDTRAAYESYIHKFGKGAHESEARSRIGEIENALREEEIRKKAEAERKAVLALFTKDMVHIPSGFFMMGSPSSEKGRYDDEGPRHRVTISRGFWMGKYEVTQAQWKAIMGNNPSRFKGDNRPVETVSWNDVQDFIKKLNAKTGKHFRLPTEAEWEYACRAGTDTAYSWGNSNSESIMKRYCWYEKNADDGSWTSPHASREGTQPVGQKQPNVWGLYDMLGNVWEWCQDWYGDYPSGSVIDPTGPSSGDFRVVRGGSWFNYARHCRSAIRNRRHPSNRNDELGFRLVLEEE